MTSKWSVYDKELKAIVLSDERLTNTQVAQRILNTTESSVKNRDVEELARYLSRHRKRILDLHEGIYNASDDLDVSSSSVKHLWLKTKEASVFVKNPNYVEEEAAKIEDLRASLIKDLQKYKPKFKPLKRAKIKEGHLLVVDPADIHIGKVCSAFETGETYNNQIAVHRVLKGVEGLLSYSNGYNIDKILFIGGNDILHVDNPRSSTTSGTPQDTDGMWYDNFLIAKKLYIEILERLLTIADVHFTFNPSNHDYTNGFFLAQVIETHFKNCKNITFDCSVSHRKYYQYGINVIGTTHGDCAKIADLPLLMAHEFAGWSDCKHRYVYTHHVHHKMSKDYMGVCVESLRSPSGTDSWHHRNGYQHAPKAVEGFIHHKEHGQVARLTNIF